MKEAKAWEDIETNKAEERQKAGVPRHGGEGGETGDILAEKVNLGSGDTYSRAKKAVKKINELQEQGNEKDAEFLKTVLNESVRGAESLAELESKLLLIPKNYYNRNTKSRNINVFSSKCRNNQ